MSKANAPKYKRILLKLSGEALLGDSRFGIDAAVLGRIANELKIATKERNVQIAVVIGGGNFFRGPQFLKETGLSRVTGDHMGMIATLMNALALRDAFERENIETRIMSAIEVGGIVDLFNRRKAIHHLNNGRVIIFAAGTGNPLVTTDSAASLRGIEIEADIILKATNVDGVYSADPQKNPKATLYKKLTYKEVLDKELAVMDLSAFCQCRDHNKPLRVFNMNKNGALLRIVEGKNEGTLVHG